jgi:hypothetical protein
MIGRWALLLDSAKHSAKQRQFISVISAELKSIQSLPCHLKKFDFRGIANVVANGRRPRNLQRGRYGPPLRSDLASSLSGLPIIVYITFSAAILRCGESRDCPTLRSSVPNGSLRQARMTASAAARRRGRKVFASDGNAAGARRVVCAGPLRARSSHSTKSAQ